MKFSTLFTGAAVAAGLLALASSSYAGGFSDTALTPNTNPPAAVGNDLLLAENIAGPRVEPPYVPVSSAPAESWTTKVAMELQSETSSPSGSIDYSKAGYYQNSFAGSGPTGTYGAGTIGSGKHTENTLAIARSNYTSGQSVVYVYVFQYVSYDRWGMRVTTSVYTTQGQYYT